MNAIDITKFDDTLVGYSLIKVIHSDNTCFHSFQILEANTAFRLLTGCKDCDITGKDALDILPVSGSEDLNWRVYLNKTVLFGKTILEFEFFDSALNKFIISSFMLNNDYLVINIIKSDKAAAAKKASISAENLWEFAFLDKLTKLPNSIMAEKLLELELRKNTGSLPAKGALLVIKVDNYGAIAGSFDPIYVSRVVLEFVNMIKSVVKSSDSLARIAEDKYALIMKEISDDEYLMKYIEKIRATITQPIHIMRPVSIVGPIPA